MILKIGDLDLDLQGQIYAKKYLHKHMGTVPLQVPEAVQVCIC